MNVIKNIVRYSEKDLESVEVDDISYLTNPNFKPSVIIGLAFGEGTFNDRLSESISAARKVFGSKVPAIAQREIAQTYKKNFPNQQIKSVGQNMEDSFHLVMSEIDTHEVLTLTRDYLEKEKLDLERALFVAHPAHTYRVVETAKGLGIEGNVFVEKEVSWPRNDAQLWVRGPVAWTLREIGARMVYSRRGF